MSSQPRPNEQGKSGRKLLVEVALLVLIPSAIIYIISLVWK